MTPDVAIRTINDMARGGSQPTEIAWACYHLWPGEMPSQLAKALNAALERTDATQLHMFWATALHCGYIK